MLFHLIQSRRRREIRIYVILYCQTYLNCDTEHIKRNESFVLLSKNHRIKVVCVTCGWFVDSYNDLIDDFGIHYIIEETESQASFYMNEITTK